jgi:hypothetical protein
MANYGSTIWPAALLDMSKEYGRFPNRRMGFRKAIKKAYCTVYQKAYTMASIPLARFAPCRLST